jgi:hypothetical protein
MALLLRIPLLVSALRALRRRRARRRVRSAATRLPFALGGLAGTVIALVAARRILRRRRLEREPAQAPPSRPDDPLTQVEADVAVSEGKGAA